VRFSNDQFPFQSVLPPPLVSGGTVSTAVCLFVCLSVCEQDNSKRYGQIFIKILGIGIAWSGEELTEFWKAVSAMGLWIGLGLAYLLVAGNDTWNGEGMRSTECSPTCSVHPEVMRAR